MCDLLNGVSRTKGNRLAREAALCKYRVEIRKGQLTVFAELCEGGSMVVMKMKRCGFGFGFSGNVEPRTLSYIPGPFLFLF